MVCFDTFYFKMCFAPQRRAIFHVSCGQLPRTRRFSEPTFRPSGATKHWKHTVFCDFPTFSRTCIFSLLTFSISYLLPSDFLHVRVSPFWLSPRPSFFLAVPFPSLHIVGSLASKLSFDENIWKYTFILRCTCFSCTCCLFNINSVVDHFTSGNVCMLYIYIYTRLYLFVMYILFVQHN